MFHDAGYYRYILKIHENLIHGNCMFEIIRMRVDRTEAFEGLRKGKQGTAARVQRKLLVAQWLLYLL